MFSLKKKTPAEKKKKKVTRVLPVESQLISARITLTAGYHGSNNTKNEQEILDCSRQFTELLANSNPKSGLSTTNKHHILLMQPKNCASPPILIPSAREVVGFGAGLNQTSLYRFL